MSRLLTLSAQTRTDAPPLLYVEGAAVYTLPIAIDSRTTSDLHQDPHFTLQKVCSCCYWDFHENAIYECSPLKGLCHPTRMREPMKTNLKKTAQLFQVVSEILEGCFYLSKSQPSFDS